MDVLMSRTHGSEAEIQEEVERSGVIVQGLPI